MLLKEGYAKTFSQNVLHKHAIYKTRQHMPKIPSQTVHGRENTLETSPGEPTLRQGPRTLLQCGRSGQCTLYVILKGRRKLPSDQYVRFSCSSYTHGLPQTACVFKVSITLILKKFLDTKELSASGYRNYHRIVSVSVLNNTQKRACHLQLCSLSFLPSQIESEESS